MMPDKSKYKQYRRIVLVISLVVPLVVALLFKVKIQGFDFSFLPPLYAGLNAMTALLLILGWFAIKKGKRERHRLMMLSAMIISFVFLVLYVLYHMTSDPTPFGGTGFLRTLYFILLISHILSSLVVIPMVLFTALRAWFGEYERHRALAKFTFPLWLYVAVTGVLVYWMISPYYGS